MFCIALESTDPYFNLALEENLLINSKEEFLILGINNPAVIIGKHQSAHKEVNTKFVTENNIPVIRRISGGGTVFHDKGNINFTFISQSEEGKQVDFAKYTKPVIGFLLTFGIEARLEGKNDIKVDGLKISGNAEHIYRNRILHHGTLLYDSSLNLLQNSLRKDKSCYTTKAVNSNPSSVINLKGKLSSFHNIYELRSDMMNYFLNTFRDLSDYKLSQSEIEKAEFLSKTKYKTWEWNYAYGPEYTFNNNFNMKGESYSCRLLVREGIIIECIIKKSDLIIPVSEKLIGNRHMVPDMLSVFNKENADISEAEIYNFF